MNNQAWILTSLMITIVLVFFSCGSKILEEDTSMKSVPVNPTHFIQTNLLGDIKQEEVELNGKPTMCYVIVSNSQASDHQMGPWCPRNLEDGLDKGGIWIKDNKVYDVTGSFIAGLANLYGDEQWDLIDAEGKIKVTTTKETCLGAAKPNVEEQYYNHCVECLPEYFKDQTMTYYIPVQPRYLKWSSRLGRGGLGLALNGVKFDPPAPVNAILAAYTIAPFDDAGGHVNPHGGYHYHAATGLTKEIEQSDFHAPLIGYAMDGFGIYALKDKNGKIPEDLDECGGHSDELRGYHYHAGAPENNQIIKCLHGVSGYSKLQE